MVSVDQAAPEVSVQLPEPEVDVDDSTGANVNIEQGQAVVTQAPADGGANVDVQQVQPSVSFEAADPNVEFEDQADPEVRFTESGEPNVRFENVDAGAVAPGAQVDPTESLRQGNEPMEAGTLTPYLASDIIGQQITNAQGQELGTVERVVLIGDRHFVILAEGGFLGISEREVALPVDSMSVAGGGLLMGGMTDADIAAMPEFDSAGAQPLDGAQQVDIATP